MEQILKDGFARLGLPLTDSALKRFRTYYEYLDEQNQVMNLTAIEGEADTARLHFLDCAALLTVQDLKGLSVIDVGSGAGFPGLPLKIAQPDLRLTLLDSLDKRVRFLRETCDRLGFDDVRCVHGRAEDAAITERGQYDAAVSRAVARLNLLAELCLPFVKVGGVFLAMKGPGAAEELEEAAHAIEVLGGGEAEILPYNVPSTTNAHNVVRIRKIKETPAKYPRRWAKIQKQPL